MKRCFIIMSFDSTYDTLLEDVLKTAAREAGFEAHRGDEVLTHTFVLSNIWRSIQASDAIIAVIKWDNSNLFYELGLAHAIQKPAIVMANKKELERLPSNLKNLIMLTYDEQHPFWGDKLKVLIGESLRALVQDSSKFIPDTFRT